MFDEFWVQIKDFLKQIFNFVKDNTLGRITVITAIVVFLIQIGWWNTVWTVISATGVWIWTQMFIQWNSVPIYMWTIILIWFIGVTLILIRQSLQLNFATGTFSDNFNQGLGKWEFGGEGWKNEKELGQDILSVSESQDGGITKRGFNWNDYEFSFETKVISECSGWIVKAENRTKYFMFQLNLTDLDNPSLRPHLRLNDLQYPWVALDKDKVNLTKLNLVKKIKLMEWIKVKILVHSNHVDVYLNGEQVMHHFIPDPIRFEKNIEIRNKDNKTVRLDKELVVVSYPIGSVGFRCAPPTEHAHFRHVRVKPLWF